MNLIVSAIIGYFIGSFPTAYLLLKKYHSINITEYGSGNVGAFNSFRVSRSKLLGMVVFIIDFMKGFISVQVVNILFGSQFIFLITGLMAAVLAHCYSPWIKFKGGRGLATAAGGGVILSIPVITVWAASWLIFFLFRRNIHFANIGAIITTILAVIIPSRLTEIFVKSNNYNQIEFSITVTIIMLIMLLRHNTSYQLLFKKNKNYQGI